ncbi:MAG: SSI family serine proteinase inhibitor [Sporichthyaceae bacterium]|jgi:hypothetical protein
MNKTLTVLAATATAATLLPAGWAQAAGNTSLNITVREVESKRIVVSLRCNPAAGSHPQKADACEQIAAAGGEFAKLAGRQNVAACAKIYLPVSVRADGLAEGKPVAYRRTFPNRCEMGVATGSVFEVFPPEQAPR